MCKFYLEVQKLPSWSKTPSLDIYSVPGLAGGPWRPGLPKYSKFVKFRKFFGFS